MPLIATSINTQKKSPFGVYKRIHAKEDSTLQVNSYKFVVDTRMISKSIGNTIPIQRK